MAYVKFLSRKIEQKIMADEKERRHRYWEDNKQHIQEVQAVYIGNHREEIYARNRAWEVRHPGYKKDYNYKYSISHGGFSRNASSKRYPDSLPNFIIRKRAIQYLGGKCVDCGLTEPQIAFDFHHVIPGSSKKIQKLINRGVPFPVIALELDKCILLCAICHRIRHCTDMPEKI